MKRLFIRLMSWLGFEPRRQMVRAHILDTKLEFNPYHEGFKCKTTIAVCSDEPLHCLHPSYGAIDFSPVDQSIELPWSTK